MVYKVYKEDVDKRIKKIIHNINNALSDQRWSLFDCYGLKI